jgi:hypothetical protein
MQVNHGLEFNLQLSSRAETADPGRGCGIPGQRLIAAGGAADQVHLPIFGSGVVGIGGEDGRQAALSG